jgi:hypothetical protein
MDDVHVPSSCSLCPAGTYSPAAQQMAAKNGKPGDTIAVSFNGADTVTVTVQRTAPTFLLRVLGKHSIPVSATAESPTRTSACRILRERHAPPRGKVYG